MMSAIVVCASCQKKCSSDAALCPHCGVQQRFDDAISPPTDRFYRPGPKLPVEKKSFVKSHTDVQFSAEELAALIGSSPTRMRQRSFGSFLRLHPGVLGHKRILEKLFFVLSLPLFAGAFTSLYAHSTKMMRRFGLESEFRLNLSLVVGGAPVAWWLSEMTFGNTVAITITTTSIFAVVGRAYLRGKADWGD